MQSLISVPVPAAFQQHQATAVTPTCLQFLVSADVSLHHAFPLAAPVDIFTAKLPKLRNSVFLFKRPVSLVLTATMTVLKQLDYGV